MNYRPICDTWILARPKVKYYGAYPNGFLERARVLLGVGRYDSVLHVCGGAAKQYPAWQRLCPNDVTLDLDESLKPTFVQDARDALPWRDCGDATCLDCFDGAYESGVKGHPWPALIADPPYTPEDAEQYRPECVFPNANGVLKNMLAVVRIGGRVGMLHYVLPQPPREGVKFVACIGVIVGFNNRMRVFSVFERTV